MRVAVVATETSQYRETAGRARIERVAHGLADAGHDVTVFCTQFWDGFDDRIERDGVTYRGVALAPTAPAFHARLPALLARHRPDVVHAHPTPPSVVLAARAGATLARAPLVTEWFGDESYPEAPHVDWTLRAPDCFVTPSELVRTRLRGLGAPDDRTTVLPEGIDMDLVREVEPAEEVDVAFAHRLDGSANVESLFLALAELRGKDWSATVVGDGPEREAYEQEAADLRIDDRVTFVGACDRERRLAIYKGAHVFVQTAYRAQFATELLWALACGCLGIVEYQAESSAHELVEQRDRAFRVTDPEAIADTIVASADHERLTVDESLAAFDHEEVLSSYVDCYERLVAERGLF